jgi:ATP-dependent DNA helicase RecQ
MPQDAQSLFQQLRAARARIAKSQGVPPYVVFHDTTLRALAEASPQTLEAMSGITGIGKAKLDRYGAEFLKVIQAAN